MTNLRSRKAPLRCALLTLLPIAATSCGSSDGPQGGPINPIGAFVEKPSGGYFFVDRHEGGTTDDLHIAEVSWGRLVDVHALEEDGSPTVDPVVRDFVVRSSLRSVPGDYVLEHDTVTDVTRLIIQRELDPDDTEPTTNGTFEELLAAAEENLAPVLAKGDGPGVPGPFSYIARNATLVLQFDDLLNDSAPDTLPRLLEVRIGSPPTPPFPARLIFDPNHGGIAQGRFHSSRILVDMTVSLLEKERTEHDVDENAVGLPASRIDALGPSVSIHIPTQPDPNGGLFDVLSSTFGGGLNVSENGPVDFGSVTLDVVRALRAGNAEDVSNGFLEDDTTPELLGSWPLSIGSVLPDPLGEPGRDFVADVTFQNPCRRAFVTADVLSLNDRFLEVRADSLPPGPDGLVEDLRVRVIDKEESFPNQLLGPATLSTAFDDSLGVTPACWAVLLPASEGMPGTEVNPGALIGLRFSEAMDPAGLGQRGGLTLIRGDASQPATAIDRVVGSVVDAPDARGYTFVPRLPLDHEEGSSETYTLHLTAAIDGDPLVTDLAGNALELELPDFVSSLAIEFTLDPLAETARMGGVHLDFAAPNEYDRNDPAPNGTPDLRGQVTYNLDRTVLLPRRVLRQSWTIDTDAALPSLMFQLPVGIPEPLSPLGSKLQTLWRYADIGWNVIDESKYDLDVEGLAWKPFPGLVNTEFYEGFRISLAHSSRLPDETTTNGALRYPGSGLLDQPQPFSANVLPDPASPPKVVHGRSLGYEIRPSMMFKAANGNDMMPFPLNRTVGPHETFTWRDTAVLATGGLESGGIPSMVETSIQPLAPPAGSIAGPGAVPSFGLPLLMEFGCFPSNFGIGVNTFALAVAVQGQLMPNFRVHSTGGMDTSAMPQPVNPDSHPVPQGGYNPQSTPPGQSTRSADPTIYLGQLDTVTRVTRVFTVWFDTLSPAPNYADPLVLPGPDDQPQGTRIEFAYRGAHGFSGTNGAELDATMLNAYGDVPSGSVDFLHAGGVWNDSIDDIDGARFIQVRMTFLNNVLTGESPELDAFAIAYRQ